MNWVIKIENIFTRLLIGIIALCFLSIVILIVTLVFLRYGFNTTIVGANEFVVILFIYTSVIGSAIVIGKKEHIAITYFIDKFSPAKRKIIDVINNLLIVLFNGVMIYYSFNWIEITGNYLTAILQIKQLFAQIVVPIGCGITIFYCVYHIFLTFYSIPKEESK